MEGRINERGDALESAVKIEPKLDESGKALESAVTAMPNLNPKDPLKPKRKKAQRACLSCQRAHLTCEDERPCQSCIKRGFADYCQDGVRKKAKYLHNAPPEALRPALEPNYNQVSNTRLKVSNNNGLPAPNTASEQNPTPQHPRVSYEGQRSTFSRQPVMQQIPVSQVLKDAQNSTEWVRFDPSNSELSHFDLESLNSGNHYGAPESGMLSHMPSGAAEIFSKGSSTLTSLQGIGDVNFYNVALQGMLPDFEEIHRQQSAKNIYQGLPHAHPDLSSYHISNTGAPSDCTPRTPPHQNKPDTGQKFGLVSVLGKDTRDSSSFYDTVHERYSYSTGFHTLTAVLHHRFSAIEASRIIKSLASVNRHEIIFMEKYFQQILLEYEELILNCCSPTLVCRRTGEVAAVNKEFTLLTGWTRDILLGKKANLNANMVTPESLENPAHGGFVMPKMRPLDLSNQQEKEGRPQPVFLAELLDSDSVIIFYEDLSRLAFGDSRESVTSRGKLLKYQTEEGMHTEIDCSFCWTMKRDLFDIPMLVVMNFLPCF